MTRRIKARRDKGVKRRNPIARALREAAYRARQEANRRRYTRKAKHPRPVDGEPQDRE
jgi:stalled ribosome alternative rescue factor ArfA